MVNRKFIIQLLFSGISYGPKGYTSQVEVIRNTAQSGRVFLDIVQLRNL